MSDVDSPDSGGAVGVTFYSPFKRPLARFGGVTEDEIPSLEKVDTPPPRAPHIAGRP